MEKQWMRVCVAIATCCAALIAQAGSDIVLIDQGDPAYTVYAGLPGERTDEVKTKISGQPAQLVTFSEFSEGRAKFIASRIVNDEYADSRAVEGIVELVRKYPGTPFGITWNGGIAFTRNDYQYAKRQFAAFSKDTEEYRRSRIAGPTTEPVNPKAHLGPLLGW